VGDPQVLGHDDNARPPVAWCPRPVPARARWGMRGDCWNHVIINTIGDGRLAMLESDRPGTAWQGGLGHRDTNEGACTGLPAV
jgi:hypothetical protein